MRDVGDSFTGRLFDPVILCKCGISAVAMDTDRIKKESPNFGVFAQRGGRRYTPY